MRLSRISVSGEYPRQWKIVACAVNAMWQEGGKLLVNPVKLGGGAAAGAR